MNLTKLMARTAGDQGGNLQMARTARDQGGNLQMARTARDQGGNLQMARTAGDQGGNLQMAMARTAGDQGAYKSNLRTGDSPNITNRTAQGLPDTSDLTLKTRDRAHHPSQDLNIGNGSQDLNIGNDSQDLNIGNDSQDLNIGTGLEHRTCPTGQPLRQYSLDSQDTEARLTVRTEARLTVRTEARPTVRTGKTHGDTVRIEGRLTGHRGKAPQDPQSGQGKTHRTQDPQSGQGKTHRTLLTGLPAALAGQRLNSQRRPPPLASQASCTD